jgi:hypothetical protein
LPTRMTLLPRLPRSEQPPSEVAFIAAAFAAA